MQITNLISLTTIIILLAFGQVRAESTNLDKFVGDWKASGLRKSFSVKVIKASI
jgi:hypothetical protein